jgi:hypothetical protein
MTTIVTRNDIDILIKELKKSSSSSSHHNNHHNSSHNHRSSNSKKGSVIWILRAVTVHLEAKTDLHKVGRKIIS